MVTRKDLFLITLWFVTILTIRGNQLFHQNLIFDGGINLSKT